MTRRGSCPVAGARQGGEPGTPPAAAALDPDPATLLAFALAFARGLARRDHEAELAAHAAAARSRRPGA